LDAVFILLESSSPSRRIFIGSHSLPALQLAVPVLQQLNSLFSQEIPSSDPIDLGKGDDWDMVGGPTERSRSPAPTVEELLSQMTQQTTRVVKPQVQAVESGPETSATTGTEEPVAAQAEEEAPVEAGLVDTASLLGAPTVTVVRSSL
jgi:hypothetical protein